MFSRGNMIFDIAFRVTHCALMPPYIRLTLSESNHSLLCDHCLHLTLVEVEQELRTILGQRLRFNHRAAGHKTVLSTSPFYLQIGDWLSSDFHHFYFLY